MIGYLAGALAAGTATFAGLHSMVPSSQLYGSNFNGLEPGPKGAPGTAAVGVLGQKGAPGTPVVDVLGQKVLALTYDDGPNDPWTLKLLEVLEKHRVLATFFMLGRSVRERPEIARAVAQAGHAVGNHSYSHSNLIFAGSARLRQELEETTRAIEEATGVRPSLFRPPFGGRRPGTFAVARELKMVPVMWRVTCYDWSAKSHQQILQHARRQIRGGEVILLHDGGHLRMGEDRSSTVRATDELIAEYKERGFSFVSVPEMMQMSAETHVAGSAASH